MFPPGFFLLLLTTIKKETPIGVSKRSINTAFDRKKR